MRSVLADGLGLAAGPLALATAAVVGAWVWGRRWPLLVPALVGGTAVAFLVGFRHHLPGVGEALGAGPAWFTTTAVLAGVLATGAVARLAGRGRVGEGVAALGVGLLAAAAALPDVEVVVAAAALGVPWAAGPPHRPPPRGGGARTTVAVAAVGVGAVVAAALVDGARGRPGSLLLAPVVVGPVVLVSLLPRPRGAGEVLARLAVVGATGVVVARHAGLGPGTARPLVASLVVLAGLGALAAGAGAVRRPRGRPG